MRIKKPISYIFKRALQSWTWRNANQCMRLLLIYFLMSIDHPVCKGTHLMEMWEVRKRWVCSSAIRRQEKMSKYFFEKMILIICKGEQGMLWFAYLNPQVSPTTYTVQEYQADDKWKSRWRSSGNYKRREAECLREMCWFWGEVTEKFGSYLRFFIQGEYSKVNST